jgi:GH35 family endo-1,4-beta-xylanase
MNNTERSNPFTEAGTTCSPKREQPVHRSMNYLFTALGTICSPEREQSVHRGVNDLFTEAGTTCSPERERSVHRSVNNLFTGAGTGKTCCYLLIAILVSACLSGCRQQTPAAEPSLKQALGDKFLIGVAVNSGQASGRDTAAVAVIKKHFNAIVPENCMKSAIIHPEEDRYDFTQADEFVRFGEANDLFITGHCLIWHSQLAPWFCTDEQGNDVSPGLLKERMKNHIHTIAGRYKGRVKGWDVVNEAILENGEWRDTPFYRILGEEFIPLAFQYAHEADPDAELYYNDYDMSFQGRRESVVKLINTLRERGLRIDAVGMQGHLGTDYPAIEEFEESLLAFAATGVKVMITEWDMSALPVGQQGANIADTTACGQLLNLYPDGLPDSVSVAWNNRMGAFLHLFIKHAGVITRVTAWGVSDGDSWKNNWPVRGRRDYPLLFDRNYQPKPFIKEAMRMAKEMRYLVPGDYMADPAVHVFDDRLYIYPSHDWESGVPENDNGDHFNMKDYHVFSTDDVMQGEVTDHGVALAVEDVPWAGRQLWDNDVARKDGTYYLYFSMKDRNDVFRIGVAVSDRPEGPFVPKAEPMEGSYSIDPAVFDDGDGNYYLYFGGLWGGQLQRYRDNKALPSEAFPADNEPALPSRVAKLSPDMLGLAEESRPVVILDESGEPLKAGDNQRRFFEAGWMHRYKGTYYFSYSTGDTHRLCYATGDNPYGPFTYRGVILTPVSGWTTHHAIAEYHGKWYLFHHDCVPSGGKTWLRSLKVCELTHDPEGRIITIDGGGE